MKKDIYRLTIDHALNPFFLFDGEGGLIDYNEEGEFLLSFTEKEELFGLAIQNASYFRGFKHTYVDITIARIDFCALSVGYMDDDLISLTLYKNICKKRLKLADKLQEANIFTLLDIAINSNMIEPEQLQSRYDISLPEFKLDVDKFLKLLNKILRALKESDQITIEVAYATGHYIKIEEKKYPVITVEISSKDIERIDRSIVENNQFLITLESGKIHIEVPFIL